MMATPTWDQPIIVSLPFDARERVEVAGRLDGSVANFTADCRGRRGSEKLVGNARTDYRRRSGVLKHHYPTGAKPVSSMGIDAALKRRSSTVLHAFVVFLHPLEDELDGGLHQPWRSRGDYFSEGRAVDVAVHGSWSVELGVVEDIECLKAELKRLGLGEHYVF